MAAAAVEKKGEGAEMEMEMESGQKMITLRRNDGVSFTVTEASARQSEIIGKMIDGGVADPYQLPKVNSKTLEKVIKYCDEHGNSELKEEVETLKNWDKAFIIEVILAAHYLNIEGLLDLTCQCAGERILGMTPEEIRTAFNIKNITEQKKEEILREINP